MSVVAALGVAAGAGLWAARWVTSAPGDPLGPVDQDPDTVRDQACRLVESSSVCSPPPPPSTIVAEGGSGSSVAAGSVGFGNVLLWLMLAVAITILLVFVVRALIDRSGARSTGEDVEATDEDPDVDALAGTVVIDRRVEPDEWRAEADRHRDAGRYRDAVRCRYRALVGDLARRGLVDEIPGRTSGEERRQLLVSAAPAAQAFGVAADVFDSAWFGGAPIDSDDDDRLQTIDAEVLAVAVALPHRVPGRSNSADGSHGRDHDRSRDVVAP